MALATLIEAQRTAAEIIDVDYAIVKELQEPRLHHLGGIALGNETLEAYRSHSGPLDAGLVHRGGIRAAHYETLTEARAETEELSIEMYGKLAATGHAGQYAGGKGVIVLGDIQPSPAEMKNVIRAYEFLMEERGFANTFVDIVAGDVGTNGMADTYALARRDHSDDPYWQGVAAGKSPELGGLEFRPAATSWGAYNSHIALLNHHGHERVSVAVQGFGEVGSWYAHFASTDVAKRVYINAISDLNGKLYTNDPEGIIITERMVQEIGDNKNFRGNKIEALAAYIRANQPHIELLWDASSDSIIEHPCDWFAPAAMANTIRASRIQHLGAKYGILEMANGPTKNGAHKLLVERGIIMAPDIIVNATGVNCSIEETERNIAMVRKGLTVADNTSLLKAKLAHNSQRVMNHTLRTKEAMGVRDLRIAAAAISITEILYSAGVQVDAEFLLPRH